MNKEKTHLFYACLNPSESTGLATYGFPVGSLPVRYLGLPLMHRKLRISEYAPLIDKIVRSSNHGEFAVSHMRNGSVINGIVNFWTSTFILPRGCIKKI